MRAVPAQILASVYDSEAQKDASSLARLAARLKSGKEKSISFDKDDDDTLDFVTATANLRAASYAIEGKTRWEVKGTFSYLSLAKTKT